MRRVIAAFNMTLDGNCDHTTGVADADLHRHYADLIDQAGVVLYGRTTYQLMQFWQTLLQQPSGDKSMDDFAVSIDGVPKIVFSGTLQETGWETAELAKGPLEQEVLKLKQQPGKDILIGSRSLIIQLLNSKLIDELQICIHPIIEGKGPLLFDQVAERVMLQLKGIKTFSSGTIVISYLM